MPEGQTFTTKIVVSGAVDPSLAKSLGISEKAMMKLNELTAKLGASNNVVAKSYMTFAPELAKAQVQATKLQSTMRRVSEIAGGVALGEGLNKGLETAIGLAEKLVDTVKEFSKQSLEVRASREVLQNQQMSVLQ